MLHKGIKLVDRISVPTQRTMTPAGQMIVPCAFARIGTQMYTRGSLGLIGDSKEVITVMRDEADVFSEDSLSSFRSAPVTINHPKNPDGTPLAVSADNAKDLQVGMLEGLPTRDEDLVTGILVITNQSAIDTIEDGTVELSAGYVCDIEEIDSKFYQRNIRANHIAIVSKGRAGSSCSLADSMTLGDDHPEPMRWEYLDDASYELAMDIWKENEAAEVQEADKAKLKQDEADHKLVVDELETTKQLLTDAQAAIEGHAIAIGVIQAKLDDTLESLETKVNTRVDIITKAQDLCDIKDISGMSNKEIKLAVLTDCKPNLVLTDRCDAYINARFDIVCEDMDASESQMSKELRKDKLVVDKAIKYVDPMVTARNKMKATQAALSK